jgi:hypothetical protein
LVKGGWGDFKQGTWRESCMKKSNQYWDGSTAALSRQELEDLRLARMRRTLQQVSMSSL